MEENKKMEKTKKKGLFKVVLLIVFGFILIGGGFYLKSQITPKTIIKKSMLTTYSKLHDIVFIDRISTSVGNNFTINSIVSLKVDGLVLQDPNNYIKNLNNLSSVINISQNADKKELLVKANGNINNTPLFDTKYFVTNSTGYVYLKNFSEHYVNIGTNNYFENMSNTNMDNYDYLIKKIIEYSSNNMSDVKVTQEKENTMLDDKETSLFKTTYIIDNKELIDLYNSVQSDLKNDSRCKEILNNIDKNILKKKISNEKELLDKDTFIKYSVYTDTFYRGKKIELVLESKNFNETYSYEILDGSELIKIIDNNQVKLKYYIKNNNNKYIVEIKDGSNKELGRIEFENTEKKLSFNYQTLDENKKVDIDFSRNVDNIKANKSYKSHGLLTATVTDLKTTNKYLVLNVNIESDVTKGSNISEKTDGALIKSSFTSEENDKFSYAILSVIAKIIGGGALDQTS